MRSAVAGASAARHAAALSRPVRGGVGQLDAAAASQPAAMADGCVAQHVGQVAGKRGRQDWINLSVHSRPPHL
eukprot:scaffold44024_cov42-Phaeocystis_antarctica.AAC.2